MRRGAMAAKSVEGVIAAVREGNFAEAAKRYAEAVAERRGLVPMQSPDPGGEDGTLPGMVRDPEVNEALRPYRLFCVRFRLTPTPL